MNKVRVIKMNVNVTSIDDVIAKINYWIADKQGRYVCVSNVHMCMEVFDNESYESVVNGADMTVPDGKPILWALKASGYHESRQVRGQDLTLEIFRDAEKKNYKIGFFGSTKTILDKISEKIIQDFPNLDIVFAFSPPFGTVDAKQEAEYINMINRSGVDVLFIGLGCPKQEIWMYKHKEFLKCTMIGVGAAFDFIAGNKKHAPKWMQNVGLEWLFRLNSEPRRLWKRYLKHNPRFVLYLMLQLFINKKY